MQRRIQEAKLNTQVIVKKEGERDRHEKPEKSMARREKCIEEAAGKTSITGSKIFFFSFHGFQR